MATRLTLLCHASTEALRAARFPRDEPIEASGERKAAALAGKLPRTNRCWTSPALRARQTAAVLNLAPAIEPALRDCDYGSWAGRSLDEIAAAEPEGAAAWISDPAAAPHGGESILDLLRRVGAWLDAQASERDPALAVTHPAIIRAAIVHAIKAEARSFWRIDIGPLSRTDLYGKDGRWNLRSVNSGVDEGGR
jgi:broad specificity phosphatase PhoE